MAVLDLIQQWSPNSVFPREAPFLHSVSQPPVSATEQTRSFAPAYQSSPVRSDFYFIIYFNDDAAICVLQMFWSFGRVIGVHKKLLSRSFLFFPPFWVSGLMLSPCAVATYINAHTLGCKRE